MEVAKVVNGTIELPQSAARWVGKEDELAVLMEGDALIFKKINLPRLTEFSERAPDDRPIAMKQIVTEVRRARKAAKRARRP